MHADTLPRRIYHRGRRLYDLRLRLREAEVEACLADDRADLLMIGWAELQHDAPAHAPSLLLALLRTERRAAVAHRYIRETRDHLRRCRHAA